jgi:hypothetical protein
MVETKPRRILLDEWCPPQSKGASDSDDSLSVSERSVRVYYCSENSLVENDTIKQCGIVYQRCGGGRRILRKHIGGI